MNLRKLAVLPILVVMLVLLLVACSSGPTDAECESAWIQLALGSDINNNATDYDSYEDYVEAFDAEIGFQISLLLNREHAPDTVGYVLKECIQNNWDYRAASGME